MSSAVVILQTTSSPCTKTSTYIKGFLELCRCVSQRVADLALTLNQRVQGSSPCAPTNAGMYTTNSGSYLVPLKRFYRCLAASAPLP
jgi:hypothetical protein